MEALRSRPNLIQNLREYSREAALLAVTLLFISGPGCEMVPKPIEEVQETTASAVESNEKDEKKDQRKKKKKKRKKSKKGKKKQKKRRSNKSAEGPIILSHEPCRTTPYTDCPKTEYLDPASYPESTPEDYEEDEKEIENEEEIEDGETKDNDGKLPDHEWHNVWAPCMRESNDKKVCDRKAWEAVRERKKGQKRSKKGKRNLLKDLDRGY